MTEHTINMPHNNGRQKGKEKVGDDAGDTSRRSIISEEPSSGKLEGESDQNQTSGRNLEELRWCAPLLRAALKGDWAAANAFLKDNNSDCLQAPINKENATALHIAAAAQHTTFVEELLKLMEPKDLELETKYGFTAVHSAAQSGNVSIAKQLLRKNSKLLLNPSDRVDIPLIVAAYLGHANMVSYLFSQSSTAFQQLTDEKRIELLHLTIYNDMYDTALKIVETAPKIATPNAECWWEALQILVNKPFAIGSKSQLSFWKSRLKYSC